MKTTFIAALALAASAGACAVPRHKLAPPSDGVMNAIEWSLGRTSRVPTPPSTDAYLLLQPRGKPLEQATRVTRECYKATSFLPGPFGDPRIFFSIEGRLYVSRARGEAPAPLEPMDPALKVLHLLAFVVAASPLQLLVQVQPVDAPSVQTWLFTVNEREILSIKPHGTDPSFEDATAFFKKFCAPRCRKGGHDCLLVSTDDHQFYLDIEPERGKQPVLFQELGSAAVRDAAWASDDGQWLYLLTPCNPSGR